MSDCPDIALLEELAQGGAPELIEHVNGCLACQGLLALLDTRGVDTDAGECVRMEIAVAERRTGALSPEVEATLEAHLDRCEACRELAAEAPPVWDREDPPG